MKMALLVYPDFPRDFWIIFLKSVAVTILKVLQPDRFFLDKRSLRNRLCPRDDLTFTMTLKEVSLALSFMMTEFSSSLRPFPRPIFLRNETRY